MFYLFFFSRREISEMRGPTGVKFCTMVSTRPYFIMPVQNFGGHTPKKFRGRKTCKIWLDFGRLRSSAANISETDEDFQNRIFIPSTAIPPALGETSLCMYVYSFISNGNNTTEQKPTETIAKGMDGHNDTYSHPLRYLLKL